MHELKECYFFPKGIAKLFLKSILRGFFYSEINYKYSFSYFGSIYFL